MVKIRMNMLTGLLASSLTLWSVNVAGNNHPKADVNAYLAASVFPYAKDLKGDLLIYHGMADDNVLFTNSTKLYKHLQDLAIPFESMGYPGKNTGIHLYKTITNFFDKHLGMEQGADTSG
ncbi:MAG: dipeptidyl-peptidase-4 [Paraglaciecola sp.]|jgi:dipeptidyl-peptidase-4